VRGTVAFSDRRAAAFRFSPACAGNGALRPPANGQPPVQPRVCGERMANGNYSFHMNGSAPRVRGTEGWRAGALIPQRFSPACAGNGKNGAPGMLPIAVQPRVCGERFISSIGIIFHYGSAPRVRGTALTLMAKAAYDRFSPACAGNGLVRIPLMALAFHDVKERHQHEQHLHHCVSGLRVTPRDDT
jgi:hypothetical protein